MEKVTVADIDRMRKNINTNGAQGAIQTYQELKNKGFGYAGWAEGVASGRSSTGWSSPGFYGLYRRQKYLWQHPRAH